MPDWTWAYEGYDPAQEQLREALCTLGNGYFATRGAAPECAADSVHYPGTYAAGCYNRLTSDVAGRRVENEDMVNLPNWLPLRLRTASGTWLSPDTHKLLDHRQNLDLRAGTLERTLRYEYVEDGVGRCLAVRQLRLVHMADPHLALLRTELTAEGWSGQIEVESALDGTVANTGWSATAPSPPGTSRTSAPAPRRRTRSGWSAGPVPPTSGSAWRPALSP